MLYEEPQLQRNKSVISVYNESKSKYKFDKEDDFYNSLTAVLSKNEYPLIKKFITQQTLSKEEIDVLMKLQEDKMIIDAHEIFLHQETIHKKSFIVNSGWAMRFKDHSNGERQIINYYLPGDIINPFAFINNTRNKHSVVSMTNLHVSVLKPEHMIDLYNVRQNFFLLYMRMLSWEDASLIEQMTCLGWLTAYQRTAYLFLNLYERLKLVDEVKDDTFFAPLTQQLLADTLSLSLVHMNRTIKKLRDDNLIRIKLNEIKMLDTCRLKKIIEV